MIRAVTSAATSSPGQLQWKREELTVGPPNATVKIVLWRLLGQSARIDRAILLLPGANSSCKTFVLPNGGLAAHLGELGFDVWMLDWRPSPVALELVTAPVGGTLATERAAYTLDRMILEDLPAALEFIRKTIQERPLTVHGHCVGGGGLATAIARGYLTKFNIDRVVLSTLGLFYEVPWHTWIKAEDFLLERLLIGDPPEARRIDPHDGPSWPDLFAEAYDVWPKAWRATKRKAPPDEFLNRLSFMVGQPYSRDRLEPSIDEEILSCFGALPMGLYLHMGQMVRRGFSDRVDVRDQIDRSRLIHGFTAKKASRNDFDIRHFEGPLITLVAAGDNGVWHRDSIDLMFEWLRRSRLVKCEKVVFAGYNIQELYWGTRAPQDTYDTFARAAGAPI